MPIIKIKFKAFAIFIFVVFFSPGNPEASEHLHTGRSVFSSLSKIYTDTNKAGLIPEADEGSQEFKIQRLPIVDASSLLSLLSEDNSLAAAGLSETCECLIEFTRFGDITVFEIESLLTHSPSSQETVLPPAGSSYPERLGNLRESYERYAPTGSVTANTARQRDPVATETTSGRGISSNNASEDVVSYGDAIQNNSLSGFDPSALSEAFSRAASAGFLEIETPENQITQAGILALQHDQDVPGGGPEGLSQQFQAIDVFRPDASDQKASLSSTCYKYDHASFLTVNATGSQTEGPTTETISPAGPPLDLNNSDFFREIEAFLRNGFGEEAAKLIDESTTINTRTHVLSLITSVVRGEENPTSMVPDIISKCGNNTALWAFLSIPTEQLSSQPENQAIILTFKQLPWHLKELLGPSLSERFRLLGYETSANLIDQESGLLTSGRSGKAYTVESAGASGIISQASEVAGSFDQSTGEIIVDAHPSLAPDVRSESIDEDVIEFTSLGVMSRGLDGAEALFIEAVKAEAVRGRFNDAIDTLSRFQLAGDISPEQALRLKADILVQSAAASSFGEFALVVSRLGEKAFKNLSLEQFEIVRLALSRAIPDMNLASLAPVLEDKSSLDPSNDVSESMTASLQTARKAYRGAEKPSNIDLGVDTAEKFTPSVRDSNLPERWSLNDARDALRKSKEIDL